MATQLLSIQYPQVIAQNVVVALPARRCLLFTSSAGAALQVSNDPAFGDNVVLTLTNGAAEVAGGFLRATNAAGATVTLKPH